VSGVAATFAACRAGRGKSHLLPEQHAPSGLGLQDLRPLRGRALGPILDPEPFISARHNGHRRSRRTNQRTQSRGLDRPRSFRNDLAQRDGYAGTNDQARGPTTNRLTKTTQADVRAIGWARHQGAPRSRTLSLGIVPDAVPPPQIPGCRVCLSRPGTARRGSIDGTSIARGRVAQVWLRSSGTCRRPASGSPSGRPVRRSARSHASSCRHRRRQKRDR